MSTKKKPGKNSIAIVYVDGPISLGGGNASPFSSATGAHSTDIRKALRSGRLEAVQAGPEDMDGIVLGTNTSGAGKCSSFGVRTMRRRSRRCQ